MNITVEEIESCKLSVTYVSGAEEILNKRGEILQAFKKAPVPGFRTNKVPLDAIKIHYKQQIEDSLKRALAEEAYHSTLFEKKIKPHGAPKFNSLLLENGKFSCEFELYTKPNFDMAPYKDLEIPKPHPTTNEVALAESMLQELRVRFGEVTPYSGSDFIQYGDNVILNYESTINGERVDSLCAEGEMLTVGASQLTVIDENILGMVLDETREFDFVVPEAGLPSLSGKNIHFKVTLNMGSKTLPCPLTDELALKVNMKSLDELRAFIHSAAMGKLANAEQSMVRESLSNRLVNDNQIDVPNWMTLSEAKYLAHNSQLNWETMPDEDKLRYMQMAEKNVKLSLILDRVREEEPLAQLSDQEVFDIIKQNLAKTKVQTSIDDVIKEMNRTGYLQILSSRIKDERTLEFLVQSAKIVE